MAVVETSWWRLFAIALVVRLVNVVLVQTSFNPDEYWQSLEPAHRLVFGYGYWTWEWQQHIRSPLYPLLFALVYKTLDIFGLAHHTDLLVVAPRLLQCVFAAIGDFYTYRLAQRLFQAQVANWAFFLSLISWFNFFVATRTLANSLETVITVAALYHWPWPNVQAITPDRVALWKSLGLAAVAVVIRPTALIIWIPLFIHYLLRAPSARQIWMALVECAFPICLIAIGVSTAVDSVFYNELTLTAALFLKFNVLNNISVFYGTHPWHWYLSQGLPFISTTLLPLGILGFWKTKTSRILGYAAIWLVVVYSLLSHKEFRFIHPILPIICVFGGVCLARWMQSPPRGLPRWFLPVLIVATQLPFALYFGLVHQRGVLDAMTWIRSNTPQDFSMTVLMPCHSTPWQSHLHRPNATLRFLTCNPPPIGTSLEGYVDEADEFYLNPHVFLQSFEWPQYLMMFEALQPVINDLLEKHNFIECARFFNSHFIDDSRRKGDIVIFCKQ